MRFRKIAKTVALIMSAFLTLGAFACGGDGNDPSSGNGKTYFEFDSAPTYQAVSDSVLNSEYKTFYFDSRIGRDENSGLNINAPKASLSELPEIFNEYGEKYPIRILLKRGSTFTGNVKLSGYASTPERPFIMDAYGDGDDYPVICGVDSWNNSAYSSVLHLEEANTRIFNIEITGPNNATGIYVFPRKAGIYENIVIDGCYVHDVSWNWDYPTTPDQTEPDDIDPIKVCPSQYDNGGVNNRFRRLYGGIAIFTGDISNSIGGPITIRNIFLQNNKIESVGSMGINFYNYWVNRPGVNYGYNKLVDYTTDHNNYETGVGYFPFENVVVTDNYSNCTGGDGMVIAGADNVWFERNASYKANYLGRTGFWNGGIWVHNTRNCVFQYNEAGYTYLRHGSHDGEGFDIDNTCENVYFQYNYAHHNEGGGILVCNLNTKLMFFDKDGNPVSDFDYQGFGEWKNNYIRNNVFVDNGTNDPSASTGGYSHHYEHSSFITYARKCNNLTVENNTIIMSGEIKNQHIINCEDGVTSENSVFRNNIFYCADPTAKPVFDVSNLKNPVFENNLYYNIRSRDLDNLNEGGLLYLQSDTKGIFDVNPEFNTVTDFVGFEKVFQFVANNASVYSRGMDVNWSLKKDIKGNDATKNFYLGAFAKNA